MGIGSSNVRSFRLTFLGCGHQLVDSSDGSCMAADVSIALNGTEDHSGVVETLEFHSEVNAQESLEEQVEKNLRRHFKVQLPPLDSHKSHGPYLLYRIRLGAPTPRRFAFQGETFDPSGCP